MLTFISKNENLLKINRYFVCIDFGVTLNWQMQSICYGLYGFGLFSSIRTLQNSKFPKHSIAVVIK